MQGIFEEPLVWLALEILLPVVPAFLLFSALPSTGEATGTFQGMHLKFGGAFAGYFGLLVLLFSFGPKPPPQWQSWTLQGVVGFETPAAAPPPSSIRLYLEPPPIEIHQDGTFQADIVIKPGPTGVLEFPSLHASGPSLMPGQSQMFGSRTIPLDGQKSAIGETHRVNVDYNRRKITVDPIILERVPAYSPSGTPFPSPTP